MSDFDIIVIGGGHAGVEAALAGARMGGSVGLISMDKDRLALMSCNPAIGGIGKSQLVKEIDALGGLMGEAIDMTGIQYRRLNLSRGPAVWSTRVQADRVAYNRFVCERINADPNITLIEGLAGAIETQSGKVVAVRLETGEAISCKAVVVCTGTFLGGLIHIGEKQMRAGRLGEPSAYKLSASFLSLGFELGRLKTGTPPRLDGTTINWDLCSVQPGEVPIPFFSHRSTRAPFEQTPCFLTYTTPATREIILANVKRSPLFTGQIRSGGPRYCPSIEDKFFRFAEKPTHQLFLEPEGNGTSEVYPSGFSTSLPEEVQQAAIRTVVGLEAVRMTRPGYAVEYDYCPTWQIGPSLETRRVAGLFFAGQLNGTSGYEEAAAQGLIAGVNALLGVRSEAPLLLDRSEAYIGVMIDDLVTRSTTEPYRMFTSRAEYRLALREDNARDRLSGYARRLGLITQTEADEFALLAESTKEAMSLLGQERINHPVTGERLSLAELIRRPGPEGELATPALMAAASEKLALLPEEARQRAAIEIRYEGYIAKQSREIARFKQLESESIPAAFEFGGLVGLKREAVEKFIRFRPASIGQAGRIEGVTPGDLAVLSVYLKRFKEQHGGSVNQN